MTERETGPGGQRMTEWYDHNGNIMTASYTDEPTGYNQIDQRTHRLFRPQGATIQALSLCGRRAHEVPGRGGVDCLDCLGILGEHDDAEDPS